MSERVSIQPPELPEPSSALSNVIVSQDLVFVSGQPAFGTTLELVPGGFREQAQQVFTNVGHCLRAAGCGYDDVVKINAYITDRAHLAAYEEVVVDYFNAPYPVGTLVLVGLGLDGMLIEVDVVARRPSAQP